MQEIGPAGTRETILRAGYDEIYQEGFRAARIDRIVDRTHLTRGAFYHHFPTKRALGEAVVDEPIRNLVQDLWIDPLEKGEDPLVVTLATLRALVEQGSASGFDRGCPLNNLAQELSPVDERFRRQIKVLFDRWLKSLARAIERAQADGLIREEVEPMGVALFVVSAIEGALGLAKNAKDMGVLVPWADTLENYFASLRPDVRARDGGRNRSSRA